jgi:hypothetical protein
MQKQHKPLPRSLAWRELLMKKGWIEDDRVKLPDNIIVYLYFAPGTTDINTIESVNLHQVSEVNDNFLVHQVSDSEQEFYLWEDIQCVRVRTKRTSLFPRKNKLASPAQAGDSL